MKVFYVDLTALSAYHAAFQAVVEAIRWFWRRVSLSAENGKSARIDMAYCSFGKDQNFAFSIFLGNVLHIMDCYDSVAYGVRSLKSLIARGRLGGGEDVREVSIAKTYALNVYRLPHLRMTERFEVSVQTPAAADCKPVGSHQGHFPERG